MAAKPPAAPKPAKAPSVPKDATSATVSKNGEDIRTYSKAEHGADFSKHAIEFASKEEGRKVSFD